MGEGLLNKKDKEVRRGELKIFTNVIELKNNIYNHIKFNDTVEGNEIYILRNEKDLYNYNIPKNSKVQFPIVIITDEIKDYKYINAKISLELIDKYLKLLELFLTKEIEISMGTIEELVIENTIGELSYHIQDKYTDKRDFKAKLMQELKGKSYTGPVITFLYTKENNCLMTLLELNDYIQEQIPDINYLNGFIPHKVEGDYLEPQVEVFIFNSNKELDK